MLNTYCVPEAVLSAGNAVASRIQSLTSGAPRLVGERDNAQAGTPREGRGAERGLSLRLEEIREGFWEEVTWKR